MTSKQILDELKKLTTADRLLIAEEALHLIHQELERSEGVQSISDRKQQLADAAELLVPDYTTDEELTSFTALDSEDFRA